MPLVVSILPSDLARARGGGERYAFDLFEALRRALPEWDHVGFVAASARADDLVPEGWTVLGGGGAARLPSGDALRARDVVSAVPASARAVICHQWRSRVTVAMRLWGSRHRDVRMMAIDEGGGSVAGLWLARLPLPQVDVGLHHSRFSRGASAVKAAEHLVIQGGLDLQRFRPPSREDRDIDVLLVARFLPHKGQDLLLEALPDGARAMLVGPSDTDDRPYLERVLDAARRRGVAVRFDATDDELLRCYQRARYTVQVPVQLGPRAAAMPPELLGLTMLEAMACGSIPICPDSGASAEFVVDAKTGFNYRAGDVDDLRRVLTAALAAEHDALLQTGALSEAATWTWSQAGERVAACL